MKSDGPRVGHEHKLAHCTPAKTRIGDGRRCGPEKLVVWGGLIVVRERSFRAIPGRFGGAVNRCPRFARGLERVRTGAHGRPSSATPRRDACFAEKQKKIGSHLARVLDSHQAKRWKRVWRRSPDTHVRKQARRRDRGPADGEAARRGCLEKAAGGNSGAIRCLRVEGTRLRRRQGTRAITSGGTAARRTRSRGGRWLRSRGHGCCVREGQRPVWRCDRGRRRAGM